MRYRQVPEDRHLLYAYMNCDVVPDIVTTAKGLPEGLPLGAVLFGGKVKHTYPGDTWFDIWRKPRMFGGGDKRIL